MVLEKKHSSRLVIERNHNERRQFGCGLMVFGLASLIYPISDTLQNVNTVSSMLSTTNNDNGGDGVVVDFDWPIVLEFFGGLFLMLMGLSLNMSNVLLRKMAR